MELGGTMVRLMSMRFHVLTIVNNFIDTICAYAGLPAVVAPTSRVEKVTTDDVYEHAYLGCDRRLRIITMLQSWSCTRACSWHASSHLDLLPERFRVLFLFSSLIARVLSTMW